MGGSALIYVPLVFAPSLAGLAGLLALAGAPSAAQWTTSYLALDRIAPTEAAGESLSWLSAANATGVGAGAGAALAGTVVDAAGTAAAFAAAAGLLALAALIVLACQRVLTGQTTTTWVRSSKSPIRSRK